MGSRKGIGLLLGLLVLSVGSLGQVRSSRSDGVFDSLQPSLERHVAVLGNRRAASGGDQTSWAGEFKRDGSRAIPARLTFGASSAMRFETLDEQGLPRILLSFDPASFLHGRSREESALLETFTSDTAEGMFNAVQSGAALRLVGRNVPQALGKWEKDTEREPCDVFEVWMPVPSLEGAPLRLKTFCFDSESGVLRVTRYRDESVSPPLEVETHFRNWRSTRDDGAWPSLIERWENGHCVFSFDVRDAAFSQLVDAPLSGFTGVRGNLP